MKEIRYTKQARKVLQKIPVNTAKLIDAKISQYAADPASLAPNVSKLKDREGYRLRVGDWRVIFDEQGNVLLILRIGPRGGIHE